MLRKNTEVIAFPHMIHYDETNYTNPEVFDPDRFLHSSSKNRHPCSYIPFSTGRKNCVGEKFSLIQLKVFMAHILHNFDIQSHRGEKDSQKNSSLNSSIPLEFTRRLKN